MSSPHRYPAPGGVAGDGFCEQIYSKERHLEPQIVIGLLTKDASGFPLMVDAFEGNKAETHTMLPVIRTLMAARQLPDVTVVADAGMISEANRNALEAEGPSPSPDPGERAPAEAGNSAT